MNKLQIKPPWVSIAGPARPEVNEKSVSGGDERTETTTCGTEAHETKSGLDGSAKTAAGAGSLHPGIARFETGRQTKTRLLLEKLEGMK